MLRKRSKGDRIGPGVVEFDRGLAEGTGNVQTGKEFDTELLRLEFRKNDHSEEFEFFEVIEG